MRGMRYLSLALLLAGRASCDALVGWEVVWMAPFLSGGGYSSEALSFVLGLARLVPLLRVAQFAEPPDDGFVAGLGDEQMDALEAMARRRVPRGTRVIAICHSTPDAWVPSRFPGWDAPELACPPPNAAISIGRTMYESDRLPADWVARCNRLDEVWVPTEFHRSSFARSGVEPAKLFVVPEPVDTAWFDPQRHEPLPLGALLGAELPPRAFVFLSVFKWEARKGWDVLLRAFVAEFGSEPSAVLLLKTSAFHSAHGPAQLAADYARELGLAHEGGAAARVRVLERQLSHAELPRLYRAADAFVLPSRGEGWGRPHAEAMAMGLPTIGTNWSGPTAFMTEANAYPVRVERLAPVQTDDEALRREGHLWAEPDVLHLRARMRQVFDDREGAAVRGRRAREDMARHFSPAQVGAAVRARLEQLAAAAPRAAQDEL